MTDHDALVHAIRAEPLSDLRRLAYCDFLEERGGPGDDDRAEFVRLQVADAAAPHGIEYGDYNRMFDLMQKYWRDWFAPAGGYVPRYCHNFCLKAAFRPGVADHESYAVAHYHRGFVAQARVGGPSARECLARARELAAHHPVQAVAFHDCPPVPIPDGGPRDRWGYHLTFDPHSRSASALPPDLYTELRWVALGEDVRHIIDRTPAACRAAGIPAGGFFAETGEALFDSARDARQALSRAVVRLVRKDAGLPALLQHPDLSL